MEALATEMSKPGKNDDARRQTAFVAALAGSLLSGCEPPFTSIPLSEAEVWPRIAEALCSPFSRCLCETAANEWLAPGCDASADVLVNKWMNGVADENLQFDPICATYATGESHRRCKGDPSTGRWRACEDECQMFFGERQAGETCRIVGRRISSCAQGLACGVDGVCYLPCDLPSRGKAGDACGAFLGEFETRCDEGLACADGTCVIAAGAESACGEGVLCETGYWCSAGTCVPQRTAGESCPIEPRCDADTCEVVEGCEFGACDDGVCAHPQFRMCVGFSW